MVTGVLQQSGNGGYAQQRTYVIGEPGSTHEGRFERMLDLIEVAKKAGCDAVKWQWISSAAALARRRKAGDYERHYEAIAFKFPMLERILEATHTAGMEALCTAYLPEDVPLIAPRVDKLKIASFEAGDPLLMRLASAYDVPRIVSTGMMTQEEVDRLVDRHPPHCLLQCVSAYPAPASEAHLSVLRWWRHSYGYRNVRVGLSDHSTHPWMGGLAVAAGAQAIEVHYRHDLTPADNADYATALSPRELREYVEHIREAEIIMGTAQKTPTPSEAAMQAFRVTNAPPPAH